MNSVKARRFTMSHRKLAMAWVFILPVLLVRLLTTGYPILSVFYYSVLDYDLIRQKKEWGGLVNFKALLKNTAFKESLSFTVLFTLVSMLSIVVLGVALALLLKTNFRGRKLIRTVSLIPWGMPMIVVSIAASWVFNDTYGIVNDLIRRLFVEDFHLAWLSQATTAKIAVIIVNVWKSTPFFAIMMLSAFQGVPGELYESAKIDGAGAVTTFFRITMPYVMRTFLIMLIFNGIGQINSFEVVYAMTRGGPGSSTSLLAYRLYMEATKNMNYGMASAITVVMFSVTAIYALVLLFFYRKVDY